MLERTSRKDNKTSNVEGSRLGNKKIITLYIVCMDGHRFRNKEGFNTNMFILAIFFLELKYEAVGMCGMSMRRRL